MVRKRELEIDMTELPLSGSGEYNSDDSMDQDGPKEKVRISEARPICTSCEQCQLRKGKCDRGQPVCGWCAANGKLCEYKERKKPGLRAGYGRNLERRLDLVEERLEAQARTIEELEHGRQLPTLNTTFTSSATPITMSEHRQSVSSIAVPQIYEPARSRSHSNVLATSWTSSPQPSIHEGSYADPQGTYLSPGVPEESGNVTQSPTFISDPDLPPAEMLFTLVELYFKHINSWFPLLDEHTTLERLFSANVWNEPDRILLHAITATAIRFSTDQRLDEATRQRYHTRSKQKVIQYGLQSLSVGALQALVIVSLDFTGTRNGGPGLNLLALVARSAVQLGLSRETYSSPVHTSNSMLGITVLPVPRDWIEDECRRRLFWLIYLLDRDATIATSFDFVVDESEIDRKLPCNNELYANNKPVETKWFQTAERTNRTTSDPSTLGPLSYMVEVKGFLTKIHQFLKRSFDINNSSDVEEWKKTYSELDTGLRDWRKNLPIEYRNLDRITKPNRASSPADCEWILLQATYFTTCIRLHSAAAYPPHKSPIFSASFSAAKSCYQEAESIITLARHVLTAGLLTQLGPSFAFSLWVGARALLVHGSTVENSVNAAVHFLIDLLRQLGRLWPVARRYSEILQRVLDDHAELQSTGAAGGSSYTSSTVAILADMRRSAHDLDMLISAHHPPSRTRAKSNTVPSQASHGRVGSKQQRHNTQPTQSTQQPTPTSTTASSAWWPSSASMLKFPEHAGGDIEYLEAFEFFNNYPRVSSAGNTGSLNVQAMAPGFDGTAAATATGSQPNTAGTGSQFGHGVGEGADWLSANFG